MFEFNQNLFSEVVNEALAKTKNYPRWHKAIINAVEMLDGNPYVEVLPGELLVMSNTSFETYRANGVCQCEAFQRRQPCKHRAGARLITLYTEKVKTSVHEITEEIKQDVDGYAELAVKIDAPIVFERETFASHTNWCAGCPACWEGV